MGNGHHPGPPPSGIRPPDSVFPLVEALFASAARPQPKPEDGVVPFCPRDPFVTIEYLPAGWDVVFIDRDGRRTVLDATAGTILPALQRAEWIADALDVAFVHGAARGWINDGGAK